MLTISKGSIRSERISRKREKKNYFKIIKKVYPPPFPPKKKKKKLEEINFTSQCLNENTINTCFISMRSEQNYDDTVIRGLSYFRIKKIKIVKNVNVF